MSRPQSTFFRFKQFDVDQSGCAMKINTDGVLLGALAGEGEPKRILDIGTGTGVIALMLSQRFTNAIIDAVEIDTEAAATAARNFSGSPFADRLAIYPQGFANYFEQYPEKTYDLIVANPPFYIDALTSPAEKTTLAKHACKGFFEELIETVKAHITDEGKCWLVLPLNTAALVKEIAIKNGLHLQYTLAISSFTQETPHREILCFGKENKILQQAEFVIYQQPQVHSAQYRAALTNFFTIF